MVGRGCRGLVGLALLLGAAGPAASAPPFKTWLREQLKAYRRASLNDKVAFVRVLSARREREVGPLLVQFAASRREPLTVRVSAVQGLADARHVSLAGPLARLLTQGKLPLLLEVEIVDALAVLARAETVEALTELLHRNEHVLVRRVLRALRLIKSKPSVKTLIRYLEQVFPNKNTRDANAPSFNWSRYRELERSILDTLQALTSKRFDILEDWQAWWNDNKRDYK